MAKWLQQIEKWLGKEQNGSKRVQSFRWLLLLGLVGFVLILLGSFPSQQEEGEKENKPPEVTTFDQSDPKTTSSQMSTNAFESIEHSFETRVKTILEQIVGVGQVDVLVTVDSTEELIVQRNVKDNQQQTEETDANGGKRHTSQYTRDGQIVTIETANKQTPVVTKRVKPKIRGVIIVAKGTENATVKQMVVDAVEKGLNVPTYRISVVPRKWAE